MIYSQSIWNTNNLILAHRQLNILNTIWLNIYIYIYYIHFGHSLWSLFWIKKVAIRRISDLTEYNLHEEELLLDKMINWTQHPQNVLVLSHETKLLIHYKYLSFQLQN